jgi:hypothetical protein
VSYSGSCSQASPSSTSVIETVHGSILGGSPARSIPSTVHDEFRDVLFPQAAECRLDGGGRRSAANSAGGLVKVSVLALNGGQSRSSTPNPTRNRSATRASTALPNLWRTPITQSEGCLSQSRAARSSVQTSSATSLAPSKLRRLKWAYSSRWRLPREESRTPPTTQDRMFWPINGESFPRLQVITIEELLDGKRPRLPGTLNPYIQAQPADVSADQLTLGI